MMTVLSICTWNTPMPKPIHYPAKLRKKLDEIAAKRDARETETDEDTVDFSKTFYHVMLGKGTVHGVYAQIDEVLQRLTTQMIIQPEYRARRVTFPPPWEGTARDVSD